MGNHLSLLKPDPLRMKPGTDEYHKQTEFARMAFGLEHGPAVNMDRDLGLLAMSSETSCGKMRAVVALLRTFKAKKQKVPPPPFAAALGRNTAQSVAQRHVCLRLQPYVLCCRCCSSRTRRRCSISSRRWSCARGASTCGSDPTTTPNPNPYPYP